MKLIKYIYLFGLIAIISVLMLIFVNQELENPIGFIAAILVILGWIIIANIIFWSRR